MYRKHTAVFGGENLNVSTRCHQTNLDTGPSTTKVQTRLCAILVRVTCCVL